ncbi:MAG: extracellular solute-binding protein [Candidatus Rokubacteria bacterium]|nr:extracellular solute-binding protein [Candidatus Rokubacteria bacterium]
MASLGRRAFLVSCAGALTGGLGVSRADAQVTDENGEIVERRSPSSPSTRPPAFTSATRLHVVRWVDFIPEADIELRRQMAEASRAIGAEITLETINANDLQPRITSAIQSGAGPDIFFMLHNWAQLYSNGLVDVSDVANDLASAENGFYDSCLASCQVSGRWMSVPHAIAGNVVVYRKSWLGEAGFASYPKTWDDARRLFATLKRRGKPYGQTLGHTFGDAPSFTYPMLWAFGGAETDRSGRNVILNSTQAIESVKFMQAFWKECCDEGGLAWDDTNNNRAFHSGEISATLNGPSIYIVARRQKDRIKDDRGGPLWQDSDHAPLPAGPAGSYHLFINESHAIMKYSKNQKLAKDFLRWLHRPENFGRWFQTQEGFAVSATKKWETDPMWGRLDEPLRVLRTLARNTRIFGYAGPATVRSTEVFTKYIVTDMYAKAVQGMSAADAVRWADTQMRRIYER